MTKEKPQKVTRKEIIEVLQDILNGLGEAVDRLEKLLLALLEEELDEDRLKKKGKQP